MDGKHNLRNRGFRNLVIELLVMMVLGATLNIPVMAEQTGDTITYSFTGTMVLTTPCSVNGDQPITVEFGNVGISKIDSGRYLQNLNYSLNCGSATSTDAVYMLLKAIPTSWDGDAIGTSADGLGVQVLKDGNPLPLNKAIAVPDPSNPPALQVLLVKETSATLTEQAFTATGTLVVDYV